jgi:hypothetical protein
MFRVLIPYLVQGLFLLGFLAQLWFGIAILGRPGNHEVVYREKSPGKFWLIILAELAVLIVIGLYQYDATIMIG